MKRWLAVATITAYLGALSWGILSHTLKVGHVAHPAMYYLVWDMFCGWSGYETRNHLVAEGESGQYYSLAPAPWGEFQAFGPAYRVDYDNFAAHAHRIAHNVLSRTEHEPIRQIYLVEENWSKRYNIPDYLWPYMFEEEKQPRSYFHTRAVYSGDCEPMQLKSCWASAISERQLMSDPRIAQMRKQSRPVFAISREPYYQTQPQESFNGIPSAAGQVSPASFEQMTQ